jgi:molybdate transport system substrate-binding protein
VLFLAAFWLSACGSDGRAQVHIAAASDARAAFEEIQPAFEEACDCDVVFTFGSSGTLATQIEEGLPIDAFFSANESYIAKLEEGGFIEYGSVEVYAIGRIVIAVPAGRAIIERLEDLTDDSIRRVSVANPEHAPYGLAAKQALEAAGVWEQVEPRLVLGENASQATTFVQTGDADAGIIPLSLAIQNTDELAYTLIDESLHAPLRQSAAVIRNASNAADGAAFIEFVVGAGAETMGSYGFTLPEGRVSGGD